MLDISIQHGRTAQPPSDPTEDQTPKTIDGLYVTGSFTGWVEPSEVRDLIAKLTVAVDEFDPPKKVGKVS